MASPESVGNHDYRKQNVPPADLARCLSVRRHRVVLPLGRAQRSYPGRHPIHAVARLPPHAPADASWPPRTRRWHQRARGTFAPREAPVNHDAGLPAYGLWGLVAVESLFFIAFAFSFVKPKTNRDWRTFGSFSAFIV